jgi:hypothetical protein
MSIGNKEAVMATQYAHPVNRTLIDEAPLGARFADVITGSWAAGSSSPSRRSSSAPG